MTDSAILLAARVLLAALFIITGLGILTSPGGFAGYMAYVGMPAPMLVTWGVIALKVLGSAAIILGYQMRYAAWALAAFSVATAFIAHFDFADQGEFNNFFKNIAIAGGMLALSVTGPGAYALSGLTRKPA